MNKLPQRINNRLKNHDYSQAGYYFITICTKNKENLFWTLESTSGRPKVSPTGLSDVSPTNHQTAKTDVGETLGLPLDEKGLPLSQIGKIVDKEINKINSIYNNVEINKYVIMPNHIHMIMILHAENGPAKLAPTVSRIIQQFKGSITKNIGSSIWQKSFHDHIIRNEKEYQEIWTYIETNPLKWEIDKYYN